MITTRRTARKTSGRVEVSFSPIPTAPYMYPLKIHSLIQQRTRYISRSFTCTKSMLILHILFWFYHIPYDKMCKQKTNTCTLKHAHRLPPCHRKVSILQNNFIFYFDPPYTYTHTNINHKKCVVPVPNFSQKDYFRFVTLSLWVPKICFVNLAPMTTLNVAKV